MFAGNIVASLVMLFGYKFIHSIGASNMDRAYKFQIFLIVIFAFALAVISNVSRRRILRRYRFSKKYFGHTKWHKYEFYKCEAERLEIRKSLGLDQNARLFLYAARVDHERT